MNISAAFGPSHLLLTPKSSISLSSNTFFGIIPKMSQSEPKTSGKFSTEQFFETQAPPPGLEKVSELASQFVAKQKESGRKVVLVTVSFCRSRGRNLMMRDS